MNVLSIAQGLLTIALSVIPWLLPNLAWYWKIIIVLLITIASLSIYCLRLFREVNKIKHELDKTAQHHNALSIQFDEKVKQERRYMRAFQNLSLILHLACQNTKEAKFKDIYEAFLNAQNEINNGGVHHG